jgi:NAD(P)-dependent dehydrogenase (short-subunit alcohol dehydrogenase family)
MSNADSKPTAMVTGGGVGLGRKISLALSDRGYRVAVTGIDGVRETTREIEDQGGEALAIDLDLTKPREIESAVETILVRWGRIDVLVNNAGIAGPTAPISEVSLEEWEHVFAVNLTGSFLCDKAVYPHMMARRSGSIVHISSMAGRIGFPLRAPYAASKWAVLGLSRTLAAELGPYNVRSNAICPGPVEGDRIERVLRDRQVATGLPDTELRAEFTENIALRRMIPPEDIADMVLFLASDASRSVTGQAIHVCGGLNL